MYAHRECRVEGKTRIARGPLRRHGGTAEWRAGAGRKHAQGAVGVGFKYNVGSVADRTRGDIVTVGIFYAVLRSFEKKHLEISGRER